ncbi:glucose-1-phosphate thymidylyltransferase RfbA [Candidatus Gracilibacteria bacterium]|nr:glucose-1-phosphate thymidylyltransferase RfbA [Candidatus Gracilibacteria bacterium]
MKGIILAGGTGSRLFPITMAISKQLMPIYDKPMIYYPISVLMLAGIREILVITDGENEKNFKKLLGDGSQFGVKFFYEVQKKPEGLAQAFIIGEKFIGKDDVCLILGDNIFRGQGFGKILESAKNFVKNEKKGKIFGYAVKNPEQYGVLEFDEDGNVLSIEEKPKNPKSKYSVPGIYFYPNDVIEITNNLKKSERGEYEITDVSRGFLKQNRLKVDILPSGYEWFDTGTHKSMMEASKYIEILEERQGIKIACLEEIAFKKGWVDKDLLKKQIEKMKNSSYGEYLQKII